MRRLLTAHPLDTLLIAALAALGAFELTLNPKANGPLAVDIPVIAVMLLAAGFRRRWPLAATLAFVAATASQASWGSPPPEMAVAFPGLLVFPYALGTYGSGWRVFIGLAAIVALVPAVNALVEDDSVVDVFPGLLSTLCFFAGRVVHSRTRLAAELHEAAVLAEEEREAESARAVAEERRRVAREMHDVVAHSISVMVVQAGGGRRVLEKGDAARAAGAAERIEAAGREALAEMRRLLGVLHPSDDGAPVRAPQPSMSELDVLIERAREAGLPLEVTEEGERRRLPPGIDLAAYRILQEALTNAIRYAGGAPTEVRVRWGADDLQLHVADRGTGAATSNRNGDGGHGLIGMRERVRLYGGELHAGRRRGGGFEVRARLPLTLEEQA